MTISSKTPYSLMKTALQTSLNSINVRVFESIHVTKRSGIKLTTLDDIQLAMT